MFSCKTCFIFALCFNQNAFKNKNKYFNTEINQIVNPKNMEEKTLKTEFQLEKEAKEMAIYNEYNELMKQPGAMATAVDEHLMKKYTVQYNY